MPAANNSRFADLFNRSNIVLTHEREAQLKRESKEQLIVPLKILAFLIAVSGLFAMIFEVRHFSNLSYEVYFTRLTATLVAFSILGLLGTKKEEKIL